MDLQIDGNAALITASSSGLGKASAKALAREGVDVVINGRNEERLADAAEEIRAVATSEVVSQPGDLTNAADIENLVERTVSEFGRLDHLVTSAGGPPRVGPLDATEEDWYDAFDLLVLSVVRSVQAAEPHLAADGGGTITNITSRSVKQANAGNVLSSSVRMGVVGFEKTLSAELAPEIRANAVLPGSHETPRVMGSLEQAVEDGSYDSMDAALEDKTRPIPADRLGDPMETGDLVAYLSSPRSDFITGQAIVVDGGSMDSTF
ncbi:oxidoreductase [Natrinema sp. CBA1119]|uniref:SDR family oxidoreductase n=1 Tax=Natrinema sp. CBA1119 TaxID=1608465 RepID=UPI000BF284C4|nr:SDR family oxidoreductase [Natrinema sp. CBA1119]PGF13928.1 oxidoreductase [Natrinema sp. CBA1119]